MRTKKSNFRFKNKSYLAMVVFIFGLLFLASVCFLYTPWVQKSRWFKIYQAKKILRLLPYTHSLRNSYEAYLKCLETNQKKCEYQKESANLFPVPQVNK